MAKAISVLKLMRLERCSEFPPLGRYAIKGEKGVAPAEIVLEVDKSAKRDIFTFVHLN